MRVSLGLPGKTDEKNVITNNEIREEMKTIRLFQVSMLLALTLIAAGCASDEAAKTEQQGSTPAGTTVFSGETNPDTKTRTAIVDHTKGAGAKVNWAATDKIWVKDNTNTWHESDAASFHELPNKAKAMFTLNGTYTGAAHDVIYTNLPITGTPQVEIKAQQTQTTPNNFDHAGASGDCAIATAHGGNGSYSFLLNHKASYICLIPRSSNEFVHRSKLTKIEIVSDNDICGTYDIAANGTLTLASGGSKTITLTTGSGFDLDNPADDLNKNAAYAVIAPGTYTLRIRYWLKNLVDGVDPLGNLAPIEGTVTKYVTMTFEAGKIHDITANLNPRNYPGNNYYMWDAQENYWYQHEWNTATPWQPTVENDQNPNYPQSKAADPLRWHNDLPASGTVSAQTTLFKKLPNINEVAWYVLKGDPRWDSDELWTTFGHLYKGGMWFKKKVQIAKENGNIPVANLANAAPDGTDFRINTSASAVNHSLIPGLPSLSKMGNYFYLPALGKYTYGTFDQFNSASFSRGFYWASTGHWAGISLFFQEGHASLFYQGGGDEAHIAQPFSDFGDN